MKNINKIGVLILGILLLNSCTKKETIIQEYNPPAATMYGTWLLQNRNISDMSKTYIIFNQNDNFCYTLSESKDGFRSSNSSVYIATDKQLNFGGGLYLYSIIGDTMVLSNSQGNNEKLTRVKNPTMTYQNWIGNISVDKTITAPDIQIEYNRSFGFNGDNLYFNATKYGNRVYKFNTLNSTFTDSMNVSAYCSNFYKSGNTYYGFSGNYKLGKTTELNSGTYTEISTNTVASPYAISYNGSSNIFYAYLSNGSLFSGTEGGAFSLLKDLDQYYCNSVVYYNSDEFLAIKDSRIHKIKISPTFSVTKSYKLDINYDFSIYTISTNGVDVWAYIYNYDNDRYEYLKLNLN